MRVLVPVLLLVVVLAGAWIFLYREESAPPPAFQPDTAVRQPDPSDTSSTAPEDLSVDAKVEISAPAKEFRSILHDLPSVETKSELREQNEKLNECRQQLVQGGDASLQDIRVLMADERQMVRVKSVSMLPEIGTVEALRVLADSAVRGTRDVRLYALQQIEGWQPDATISRETIRTETLPAIFACMSDEDESLRTRAMHACQAVAGRVEGFKPDADKSNREESLKRLKSWWNDAQNRP